MSEISDLAIMKEYEDQKKLFQEQRNRLDGWFAYFFKRFVSYFRPNGRPGYFEEITQNLCLQSPEKYSLDESYGKMNLSTGLSSETFRNKTPRQLFSDFENAILESGVDSEILSDAVNNHPRKSSAELEKIFLPIYLKIREKGYNHRDITI